MNGAQGTSTNAIDFAGGIRNAGLGFRSPFGRSRSIIDVCVLGEKGVVSSRPVSHGAAASHVRSRLAPGRGIPSRRSFGVDIPSVVSDLGTNPVTTVPLYHIRRCPIQP